MKGYPSPLAACPFWALTARVARAGHGQALPSPLRGEDEGEGCLEKFWL